MPDTKLREWAREPAEAIMGAALVKRTYQMREFIEQIIADRGESLIRQCAEIARHFANDNLTPDEWPDYGLYDRARRFDNDAIGVTGENIQRAILRYYGIGEGK